MTLNPSSQAARCVAARFQHQPCARRREKGQASHHFFALDGRVAAVIGGNRGIGRSVAFGTARAGAAIALLAREKEKSSALLAELQAMAVPAMASHLDVTEPAALADVMGKVERALGSIDVLVDNAGVGGSIPGVQRRRVHHRRHAAGRWWILCLLVLRAKRGPASHSSQTAMPPPDSGARRYKIRPRRSPLFWNL